MLREAIDQLSVNQSVSQAIFQRTAGIKGWQSTGVSKYTFSNQSILYLSAGL